MKFWVLNITGCALFLAGAIEGSVLIVFSDTYHLTWFIAGAFLWGLYRAAVGDWDAVEWVSDRLVRLGLLGTVLGLAIAFYGVAGQENVSLRDLGAATALYTTIVGLVGSLWLELNQRLFDETPRSVH